MGCQIFQCRWVRSSLLNRVSQFGTVAKVSSMPGQTKQAAWSHGCIGKFHKDNDDVPQQIFSRFSQPTHPPLKPGRISPRYRNRKVRLDFIDMPGYGHSARAKVFGPEALEFVRNRHLGGSGEGWAMGGQKAGKVITRQNLWLWENDGFGFGKF